MKRYGSSKIGCKPLHYRTPCSFPIFRRKVMRGVWILYITQPFRSLDIIWGEVPVKFACETGQYSGIFARRLRKQGRGKEAVEMQMRTIGPGKLPLRRSDYWSGCLYPLIGHNGSVGHKASKRVTRYANPLRICPSALGECIDLTTWYLRWYHLK
jgi:hypothetical protein